MAKLSVAAGATSQSVNLFIQNSTSTTGAGLTAVAPAGGSLLSGTTAYYSFSGANAGSVAISLTVLAATTTAWTSGGIVTIDDTHMAGWVRLDIPNAVVAASKGQTVSGLIYGGTNMAPCPFEIEITGWNNQDAVHGGMSALPATACTTNASLLTSGTGTDQLSVASGKVLLQATQTGVTIPTVTTVTNQLTAAQIATGIFQDTTAGDFTVSGSIGKSLFTSGAAPGAAGGFFIAGTNAATSITTALTANITGSITGNLSGSVGSVTGAVGSVTGAVGSVTGNVGGNVTGSVGSVVGNVGGNVAGSVASVTAAVSLLAKDSPAAFTGTATAGGASTITLQTALGANSLPNGETIKITSGTGAGQARVIAGYVDSTQVVTVDRAWTTNPDNTSVYTILFTDAPKTDSSLQVTATGSGTFTANVTQIAGQTASAAGAVTFPGTIASPTNITAGTITTATNLTNLPSIPNNWLTAAGIAAGALDGKGDWLLASSYTTPPTTAAIATAIFTDTTGSDFTVNGSPGKILVTQLGGTFTTQSSSVFTTAALANAPTGGSAPTAAQNATAVWTDLLSSSDFSTSGSIGALLKADTGVDTSGVTTLLSRIAQAILFDGSGNVKANAEVVSDKTGYSLMQAFPANFGSLAITPGGAVTVGSYASGEDPATLVLGAAAASWDTAGTIGAKINTAGAYSDPLAVSVPGSYGAGTVGYLIGTNLNATVSSRSTYSGTDTPGTTTLLSRLTQAILFDGSGYVEANAEVVSDKTGYSLSQAFPANFASLGITSGGAVTINTATVLNQGYAALHAEPTIEQAFYMILQTFAQFSITGTTITVQKIDGTTTAMTFGTDSPTAPTLRNRLT